MTKARLESRVLLPHFVRDCLAAKCRDLNVSYIIMLLKDLVKVNQNWSGGSSSKADLLVHSSSPGNEVALSKVGAVIQVGLN